jgi:spoIIIJ-associated protein
MEFEGRTEREAVARAAAELGSESFDVEVLERSGGLFGRSKVRIRVKALTSIPDPMGSGDSNTRSAQNRNRKNNRPDRPDRPGKDRDNADAMWNEEPGKPSRAPKTAEEPEVPVDPPTAKMVKKLADFVEGMIQRMGYTATVAHTNMEGAKLIYEITSDSSNILIGKKGKNLDALQLLANVYLNRIAGEEAPWRIVLDTESYRARREEALVRMANRMADEAVRTRTSRLLEPMNPFERRLIHTAINDRDDVVTKSEGEGLYKRVRIMAKGAQKSRSRNRR